MKSLSIEVIDIESVLPIQILSYNEKKMKPSKVLEIPKNEVVIEQNVIEYFNVHDNTTDKNTEDDRKSNYHPDLALGELGEKYIEKRLLDQYEKHMGIVVERVSETRKNKSPGYDIEIKNDTEVLYGIEVKSKSSHETHVIQLTNNELKAMIKLKEKSYLIIVFFEKGKEIPKEIYCIKDFIKEFKLDLDKLKIIIGTTTISNVEFYPQVFVINLPKDTLSKYKTNISDNII